MDHSSHHTAGGAELAALKHESAQAPGVDVEEPPEEDDLTAPVATSTPEGTA
jgi:simple sugar transport system ATP-binding protein